MDVQVTRFCHMFPTADPAIISAVLESAFRLPWSSTYDESAIAMLIDITGCRPTDVKEGHLQTAEEANVAAEKKAAEEAKAAAEKKAAKEVKAAAEKKAAEKAKAAAEKRAAEEAKVAVEKKAAEKAKAAAQEEAEVAEWMRRQNKAAEEGLTPGAARPVIKQRQIAGPSPPAGPTIPDDKQPSDFYLRMQTAARGEGSSLPQQSPAKGSALDDSSVMTKFLQARVVAPPVQGEAPPRDLARPSVEDTEEEDTPSAVPPSPPIETGRTLTVEEVIGRRAYELSRMADGGVKKWHDVCAARSQLQQVAAYITERRRLPIEHVFVFGGCLAFGIWDGLSDVDFCVINVASWTEAKDTTRKTEEDRVEQVDSALQNIGFPRSSLTKLTGTRVPIVKHKTATKGKSALKPSSQTSCVVRFNRAVDEDEPIDILFDACNAKGLGLDGVPVGNDDLGRCVKEKFREVTFPLRTSEDVITFALNVPWEVPGRYQCTHCYPHYRNPPVLSKVDFDVSFRGFGIRNSWLLRHYLMQHRCGRMGAIIIKKFAKNVGLSDSRNGFLTSYAMVILWIYYLLQRGLVRWGDPQDVPIVPHDAKSLSELYRPLIEIGTNITEYQVELGTILRGFFSFYSVEFNWGRDIVSLNRPGLTSKESLHWTLENQSSNLERISDRVWYLLCIEDPYEVNLNLGRHINTDKMQRIQGLFGSAVDSLGTLASAQPSPCAVFDKPEPPDLKVAYTRVLAACKDLIKPEGIAVDVLHNLMLSKVYAEWIVVQTKYDRLTNFLRDHGKKICQVEDRIIFPPPPPLRRGTMVTKSFKQMCMQCNKVFSQLWMSNDRMRDNGLYCDDCWKAVEQV